MSQANDAGVNETPGAAQGETLFDEGFSFGEDENAGSGDTPQAETPGTSPDPSPDAAQQETQAPQGAAVPDTMEARLVPPAYPVQAALRDVAPATQEPEQRPAAKTAPVPEGIAEELESLKKLNPEAAALALEDSAEGASVRARLEQYGADIAQDRAEQVMYQRRQEEEARKTESARAMRARDAHNAAFMATLQRDHPAYTAMITDPARKAEAAQYQQDVFSWIAAKPYSEAAALMETAKNGRDPAQVSVLLKQFESERGKAPKQPDPTGALAVPGRGAPAAPSGIGDKGDFDAGWNANPSK